MAPSVTFDVTPEQEASKFQFLRRQFFEPPPAIKQGDIDLTGKTAIVTGANSGIGLEAARHLLNLGISKLIIGVRSEAKGEAARKELIAAKALVAGQSIEVWKLDYASYDSVTAFVQRAEVLSPPLDIAILNAGVNRGTFDLNPTTGHEETVQTNYLSTVLLVILLLRVFDKTKSAAASPEAYTPGRIVVVSSDTAAWAKFNEKSKTPLLKAFDDKDAKWDSMERYSTSKLLGQLFVAELAKRVPSSLAILTLANPGLCYGSSLAQEFDSFTGIFIRLVGRSSAVGAGVIVQAAIVKDESLHGQYFEAGKLRP